MQKQRGVGGENWEGGEMQKWGKENYTQRKGISERDKETQTKLKEGQRERERQ